MTQQTDSAPTSVSRFYLPSVLFQSAGWIGAFSLFGSNFALAQTTPSGAVPRLQNFQPTTATASSSHAAAPRLERLRQKLRPTIPVKQSQPQAGVSSSAGSLAIPNRAINPVTKFPSTVGAQPSRIQSQTNNNSASDYSGTHIDPTAYSIGATKAYEAPNSVVLKERSTGCRAVLRQGQAVSGFCGTSQRRVRFANRTRQQTPTLRKNQGVAVAALAPVRVGPIAINSHGFSTTADTQYNGKLHPTGKLGNPNDGMLFPLTVPTPITSLFGWRVHPISGDRRFHTGTDLGAPLGTPVLAAETGSVAYADFWGGYGLTVVLDHNKVAQQTLYAHLSEIFVQPGEWVERGTVIGRVGNTGNSTGPHLHFESRQLTPAGWVANDPGIELQAAMVRLADALQVAKAPQPQVTQTGTGNSSASHSQSSTKQPIPAGWARVDDPGIELQAALARLVEVLQVAKVSQQQES